MNKSKLTMSVASCAMFVTNAAMASEPTQYQFGPNLTVEQAASMLHYSGGNDRMRVEIAPNYSEELGFSLKGAVGGYLTDAMALGLIVEYGEHKREYLANAGIQFTDELSLVGTVGLLEEHNEYVDGEGREEVQQMEYGASFKGAYEVGILSGFELNGYLADADADSDNVETGKLYGVQLLADLDLTDTTHFKLGGGYEWLEWDDTNDDDSSWTFSAEAAQQLGDTLSLTGHAKLGASEYVYGGGLAFDLSNGGPNTNTIGVNYSYIDGKNGIEDDQRVELSWSIGFGSGPTQMAAVETRDAGAIRPVADLAVPVANNRLLGEVMKRPTFLPERVVAKAAQSLQSPIPDGFLEYNNTGYAGFIAVVDAPSCTAGGTSWSLQISHTADIQFVGNFPTTHATLTVGNQTYEFSTFSPNPGQGNLTVFFYTGELGNPAELCNSTDTYNVEINGVSLQVPVQMQAP